MCPAVVRIDRLQTFAYSRVLLGSIKIDLYQMSIKSPSFPQIKDIFE